MTTIPFDVRNRWSGEIQFTAQIECDETVSPRLKLGLAVQWARKSRADLRGADLSGADLSGADLSGADLSDADLSDADLSRAVMSRAVMSRAVMSGADLSRADLSRAVMSRAVMSRADLRSFKADLWMTLTQNRAEVPGLIHAMREGRIDGSVYSGECACLVGTIANVRGVDPYGLDHGPSRPAERWFMMIRKGDKPGDDTGGGFALKTALDWTLEWSVLNGAAVPEVSA